MSEKEIGEQEIGESRASLAETSVGTHPAPPETAGLECSTGRIKGEAPVLSGYCGDTACEAQNAAVPKSSRLKATSRVEAGPAGRDANAAGSADGARNASVGSSSSSHQVDTTQPRKRAKSPFRTARGWVALACVAFVLVGLALHVGIGTPSAFGIQQISAICPLGALETMAGAKGVMLHPLLLFALVVLLIALVGKAFCAWMCPMPWLQRFFRPKKKAEAVAKAKAAKTADDVDATLESDGRHHAEALAGDPRVCGGGGVFDGEPAAVASAEGLDAGGESDPASPTKPKSASSCAACPGAAACGKALVPVGGKRDGVQLDTRHAVLAGALASAAVFGFPVFCLICPVGLTFATIIGLWNLVQFDEPSWALIVFPVILLLEVTVLRKWCSKICPISALVSLLSNLNVTLRPRVNAGTCLRSRGVDCHACVDVCPEQLDPHSKRIPECSKCGACVEACPAKAISIKLLK